MFKLSEYPKVARYTLMEHRLFNALPPRGRRVTSQEIADAQSAEWNVKKPVKNVTVHMTRLIEKVDANQEPFRIARTYKVSGRYVVEYWLEKRTEENSAAQQKRQAKARQLAEAQAAKRAGA